ncbi:hypothetical protein Ancab_011720 [Ancistrocladus abbreviatus]
MCLCIVEVGLSYDTNETILRDAFIKYGQVIGDEIVTCDHVSGNSRGYGSVKFASETAASSALKEMNNQEFFKLVLALQCRYGVGETFVYIMHTSSDLNRLLEADEFERPIFVQVVVAPGIATSRQWMPKALLSRIHLIHRSVFAIVGMKFATKGSQCGVESFAVEVATTSWDAEDNLAFFFFL